MADLYPISSADPAPISSADPQDIRYPGPQHEERRLDLAMLTNLALLRGRVPQLTGNPKLIREETRVERAALEERVYRIAAQLRPEWERRVEQVDVHGLRKTHRSWAQARGVPPVVIDKQLGHADPGEFEVVRALAGSDTGRKHYLDLSMELFDAGLSAKAVREMLDEAVAMRRGSDPGELLQETR